MDVFLIEDDELLGKLDNVWKKDNIGIKRGFESKPIYNKKFWKPK